MRTLPRIPTWCRNLSHRPPRPAAGRGRVQRQVRRALWAHDGMITTPEACAWAYRQLMWAERINNQTRDE